MYTPIFAMARCGGWLAHVLEYQEDNRLIRPRGRYVGAEERSVTPIDER
jgi:citrate synthase